MDQTFPLEHEERVEEVTSKSPRSFSKKMEKLRKPFLGNETCDEQLRQNEVKENWMNSVKNDTKEDLVEVEHESDNHKTKAQILLNDKNKSRGSGSIKNDVAILVTDVNKSLEESFTTSIGRCDVSDYFTGDSENKTNYSSSKEYVDFSLQPLKNSSLMSNTSLENFSFSDSPSSLSLTQPLRNSTFMLDRGETTKKSNETFLYEDNYHNNRVLNSESLQVPLISKKCSMSVNFEKEVIMKAICREYEKNRKLKETIKQMALYLQIETKDKVMRQLLELAKFPGFPQLKHFCIRECERDNEGKCKKSKRLPDEHNGVIQYIWSYISYPFASNSTIVPEKDEGVVKIIKIIEGESKAIQQGLNETDVVKENAKQLDDNREHKATKNETKSYKITDYIWRGEQNEQGNSKVDKDIIKETSVKDNAKQLDENQERTTIKNLTKSYKIIDYIWGGQKKVTENLSNTKGDEIKIAPLKDDDLKGQISGKNEEVKKKSKFRKNVFYFARKAEKSQKEKTKKEKKLTDATKNMSTIESMEDIWKEMEENENEEPNKLNGTKIRNDTKDYMKNTRFTKKKYGG